MTTALVFDIHPLVESIAHNLTPGDLCCCVLVSYAWHTNFSRFLWHRIRLYSEQNYGKFDTPNALGALARHVDQVQVVETNIPRLLDLLDNYPLRSLSTLRVGSIDRSSRALVQMFARSTNLQTLELLGYFGQPGPIVEQFLLTLRTHPRLREFNVTIGSYTYTPKAMIRRLLLSCGNLETIFAKMHFESKELPSASEALLAEVRELTGSESPSFKVKDLTIGPSLFNSDDLFADFLRFCPNVEQLDIPVVFHNTSPGYLTKNPYPSILRSTMKGLRHLTVCSRGAVNTSATELILSCTALQSYYGQGYEEDPRYVVGALLNSHHSTLTVVELSGHGLYWTSNGLVHSFLCMCPSLRIFRARGSTKAVNTAQSPMRCPQQGVDTALWSSSLWACEDLISLEVSFRSRLLHTNSPDARSGGESLELLDDVDDFSTEFVPELLVLQLGRLKKLERLLLRRITQVGEGGAAKLQELPKEQYETSRKQVSRLFATLSTLPELRRVELQGMREAMVQNEIDDARQCLKHIKALWYYDETIHY